MRLYTYSQCQTSSVAPGRYCKELYLPVVWSWPRQMYRLCSICFTYANFKELLNHMTIYCSNTRLLVLYNIFYWLKMAGLKLMSSSGVGFIHELPTVHKSLSVVVLRQNYLLYIVVSHPIETLANGTIIIFYVHSHFWRAHSLYRPPTPRCPVQPHCLHCDAPARCCTISV